MKLYKCTSDPNALVPNYTDEYPASGEISTTPYEPVDDLNGYVILDYNSSYEQYNKAFLYGKYYTITSHVKEIGGKIRLNLQVDVMKTYADEISSCTVIVQRTGSPPPNGDRNSNGWNALIQDARNVVQANNGVIEVAFTPDEDHGVTDFGWDNSIYLMCIGAIVDTETQNMVKGATIDKFSTYET